MQHSIPEEKEEYNPAVFIIKLQAPLSVVWNTVYFLIQSTFSTHSYLLAGSLESI